MMARILARESKRLDRLGQYPGQHIRLTQTDRVEAASIEAEVTFFVSCMKRKADRYLGHGASRVDQ